MRRGLGALVPPLALVLLVGTSAAGTWDVGVSEEPVIRLPLQDHLDKLFGDMDKAIKQAQEAARKRK